MSASGSFAPFAPAPSDDVIRNRLVLAAGIAGAAFIGFGLIMWVAANWDDFSRLQKLSMVGGAFALASVAAMAHTSLRIPGALVAFCAMGGLFSLFGQVYQSGSDPWVLFGLWAALGLPLALAARHDAVWLPWVVVVFTAIPLWVMTYSGQPWPTELVLALPLWLAGAVIAAGLWVLGRWNDGEGRWAFRLSVLLTLSMIVSAALPAVFNTKTHGDIYIAGLLAVVGVGVLMWRAKPMEFGLLAAAGMALDTLLIAGLFRLLFEGSRSTPEAFTFLFGGLIAAGIVAATATPLLRIARAVQTTQTEGETTGASPVRTRLSTWPVTAMSGFGALLAAIPCLFFYFLLFKDLLKSGPGIYLLGLMTMAGGLIIMRLSKPMGFGQQFGFIGLVVGLLLFGGGLVRDTSIGFAALGLALVLTATALLITVGWIQSLLGAGAATGLTIFLSSFRGARYDLHFASTSWIMVAGGAALVLFLLGQARTDEDGGARWRTFLERYTQGFAAAALLGLMGSAGQTFLFGTAMGMPRLGTSLNLAAGLSTGRMISLGLALAGCAILIWREKAMRAPVALVIMAVMVALSSVTANLGPVVLLGAVAFTCAHRSLAGLAFIASLWIIGTLYYWLGWPLTDKAWLMCGLGAVLGLAAAVSGLVRPSVPAMTAHNRLGPALAAALIGVSTLATAGIIGQGVMDKESTIATGRKIYIALAPVDPRSLMQGDYMALRFALPRTEPGTTLVRNKTPMMAIATLDARDIATIVKVVPAGLPLAAGQISIVMKEKHGQWIVGTDAWYFKEGKAKAFEKAKFGEFRLSASGDAILIGMADENLNPLR